MKKRKKITKDIVPDDFSLALAFTDLFPVFFFGASMFLIGSKLTSVTFTLGASLCMLAGTLKVLWKIIVVLRKKNIWPLFIQMRIMMPIGFLFMLIGLFSSKNNISSSSVFHSIFQLPSGIFFLLAILGMVCMSIFAIKLDSSDSKSNWLEQITNGLAQLCLFIGLLLLH